MSFTRPDLAHGVADPDRDAMWTRELDDEFADDSGHYRAFAKRRPQPRAGVRLDQQDGAIPGGGTLPAVGDTPDTIPQQLAALAADLARLADVMGPNAGLAVNARRLAWDLRREWGL